MVREEIERDLERFSVPGASWAVIEDGEITQIGTAGVIEAGGTTAVAPNTLFQAASISKPVAVLAMLRLVDRGLLDLDEDVNQKLRSWQVPSLYGWQPRITLRQLASHTAGLTVSGVPGYMHDEDLPTTVQTLNGVRPAYTGVLVDLVPGTQFRYSGGGMMVMQQLLEDVTDTPFRQLAQELVLQPLGMSDSDYAHPLPQDLHPRTASGHDELGHPLEGRWHAYPQLAAAGLWTTPTDLAKFAIAVQRAYAGAEDLLSRGLAREMLTPQIAATDRIGGLTALGLGVFLGDSGLRFGHGGSNAGYRCHLLAFRDTGQGAAMMTNGEQGSWVLPRAFARAASTYGWDGYPDDVAFPELPADHVLEGLVGAYRLDDRVAFAVERRGSGLEVTFEGQPPLNFTAHSATGFSSMNTESTLELREGQLVFGQGGTEFDCTRE